MRCGADQRSGDLDGGDDHDQRDRSPGLLAGVEHSKLQQHQRIRDQGERRHRDRDAEVTGVDVAEVAVGEQRAADRGTADGHRRHDRDQRHHRQPGGQRQVGQHRGGVVGGGVAAQPWHHHGQHRDPDDAERQHQHQPGVVVDRRAGSRSATGDSVADDQTDLADQHVEHHRGGHRAELFQAVVDSPQWAQADPFAPRWRRAAPRPGSRFPASYRCRGPAASRCPFAPDPAKVRRGQPDTGQGGDRDDVVAHRRPSRRTEYVAGVQDRHEHRRQPVEQHLRQQEIGERGRQAAFT